MLKIIHRINTIEGLRGVPQGFGVEADIRTFGGKLVLNHEPNSPGESLENYLQAFSERKIAFGAFEVKEEGIERQVISLCEKHAIPREKYFLFSVSPPFTYLLARDGGIVNLAVRFSEWESLETPLAIKKALGKKAPGWVWVDTFTKNPLSKKAYLSLKRAGYKICLVCPERWGRPGDIPKYVAKFKKDRIAPDAVMTSAKFEMLWKI